MSFYLTAETKINTNVSNSKPIENIIKVFKRDLANKFESAQTDLASTISLDLNREHGTFLAEEQFLITFPSKEELVIQAPDELGAIYGLLHISQEYLGVQPFGFWHDQVLEKVTSIKVPIKEYKSPLPKVRFRGWFVNDEVLISEWKLDGSNQVVWKRVFETLLRCQGNMVIPGTDHNSKKYRQLATDMGLWITHHHAEPLGAEMFLRVYPDKEASYVKNKALFEEVWVDGILEQQDSKVVWNVGFRGQGDKAFWHHDSQFSTAESRGKLISQVIQRQCEIVRKYVENPVFCTNLYGEILELYAAGHIEIPEDVIKIWGDSGYGKMVSRRQGNHNPRMNALAPKEDQGLNGIYYHASFYDLQASSVLTMLANSPEFINQELEQCFERNMDEYWIINCGNVKPHSYILDLIKHLWLHGNLNVTEHRYNFLASYFNNKHIKEISQVFDQYFTSTIHYGTHDDERAAEQFYHHPARAIIDAWVKGKTEEHLNRLYWATGKLGFPEQVQWFKEKCLTVVDKWEKLLHQCQALKDKLPKHDQQVFEDMFIVQVKLHYTGCKGFIALCESFEHFQAKKHAKAFVYASEAMEHYNQSLVALKETEHEHWQDYYHNDCLTNVKLTVYFCDTLRRYIRMIGDGPNFYQWERNYLYDAGDKNIILLTNTKNQLTDDELYVQLKQHFS